MNRVINSFTGKTNLLSGKPECPYIKAEIELPKECVEYRRKNGIKVPDKMSGVALLDTGATNSHITKEVLAELNPKPTGIKVKARSIHGSELVDTYLIQLSLPDIECAMKSVQVTAVDNWFEVELENQPRPIAIIGVDILSHLIFNYNGPEAKFTLSGCPQDINITKID